LLRKGLRLLVFGVLIFLLVFANASGMAKGIVIKVGYFPNITHAQALIGMADGTFRKELGEGVEIQPFIFNAGPSVIEAMMAGQLDLAYIGPNPAINGYIKTKGTLLNIIAGAASGGAALVVRADLGFKKVEQFNGQKLGSPQLGNTQDVALRYYLKKNNLKLAEQGGTVQVIPIANPDQLTLFLKKEIAGAWTVEPWVSRLVTEAGGVIFCDERDLWPSGKFTTANVIVSQAFLKKQPDLVKKWLKAHVKITLRINANLKEAQKLVNNEIERITSKALPDQIISQAFSRFEVTYDPLAESMFESADHAFELGFLGKEKPDLRHICDLRLLNQVLVEMKLPVIK
jgi:NitT/TauT family transport system substrate-binding protein